MTGVTNEEATTRPSGAPEFTQFCVGVCVTVVYILVTSVFTFIYLCF